MTTLVNLIWYAAYVHVFWMVFGAIVFIGLALFWLVAITGVVIYEKLFGGRDASR